MKAPTVKSQIQNIVDLIAEGEADQARAVHDEVSKRRLTKEQIDQLVDLDSQLDNMDEDGESYQMSNHMAKYRARYQRSVAASGAKSLNNGDELANYLEMKTGKEVCELADQWVPLKDGQTHYQRYERLNEGQKRMNSGNKLRAALKNGTICVTENGIRESR